MSEASGQEIKQHAPRALSSELTKAVRQNSLDFVKKTINSFPFPEGPDGVVDDDKFAQNVKTLTTGIRVAILECLENGTEEEQNEALKKKWRGKWEIALYIFNEFIAYYPTRLRKYIELEPIVVFDESTTFGPGKISSNQTYDHLIFSNISPVVSAKFERTFLDTLVRSAFLPYKDGLEKLEAAEFLDTFCFLIQTFRGMGWGRSIKISDNPKQGLKDFQVYLKSISPEISQAISTTPPKTLTLILSGFVAAFKAGKAEDDLHLETEKVIKKALNEAHVVTDCASIIYSYFDFFGPRVEARKKAEEAQQKSQQEAAPSSVPDAKKSSDQPKLAVSPSGS